MGLVINHNLMAMAASRNLGATYGMLAKSIARLSSGLRINSSADDAAGLAVREFMRSEIAVLNQGVRNANDAVSMLQTMDGAAQVIDEKLIRMKELAEQAATGTYSIAQRAIMHSEFAAMRDEIERISQATDFNGVKMLNGIAGTASAQVLGVTESLPSLFATNSAAAFITAFSGYAAGDKLTLSYTDHDGTTGTVSMTLKVDTTISSVMGWINSTAADRAQTLGVTENNSAAVVANHFVDVFTNYRPGDVLELSYTNNDGTPGTVSRTLTADTTITSVMAWINSGTAVAQTLGVVETANNNTSALMTFVTAFVGFTSGNHLTFGYAGHNGTLGTVEKHINTATSVGAVLNWINTGSASGAGFTASWANGTGLTLRDDTTGASKTDAVFTGSGVAFSFSIATAGADDTAGVTLRATWSAVAGHRGLTLTDSAAGYSQAAASLGGATSVAAAYDFSIDTIGWDATSGIVNLHADWTSATGGGFTLTDVSAGTSLAAATFAGDSLYLFSIETAGVELVENVKIHFGTGNSSVEDYYYVQKQDMTSEGLGIADLSIATQASAQATVETLNDAIAAKDTSRAHFGAMMNRLANTVSNIQIQAENIQAAESQISDVDVALEMTKFVSNQIKAQAAVAMLAQANTLPQLALTLLGGR